MEPIAIDAQLSLRPVARDDASTLFALVESNRLYLRQWLPWVDATASIDDMQGFLLSVTKDADLGTDITLAITLDDKVVGICSLNAINTRPGQARIGYWLAENYCGSGIMTRSVNALCHYGFATLKLHTLVLCAAEHNQKSRAVAERLGFHLSRKIMAAEDLYGESINHIRYTLNPTQHRQSTYDPRHYSA
ncbi:GNAT family N-acetyltransferase [Gilvimarinus xylanilyticus]|uniref:GNAT family N-acetyltransferase n=1 Tax=Gilvimarinus xylanilyticus TaxID=2944139 RepID=A0A9X2HXL3_9GAMM|nr:GNAT family N-acetyltransferase [Gilvimarinus xylanilyticus]MCP8899524.1 GNAT family N-acetyltransferase [Gilvimarinus xylanilyticus]